MKDAADFLTLRNFCAIKFPTGKLKKFFKWGKYYG